MGTWDVCAWRAPDRTDVHQGGRFAFLGEALNAADALAAKANGLVLRTDTRGNRRVKVYPRDGRPLRAQLRTNEARVHGVAFTPVSGASVR